MAIHDLPAKDRGSLIPGSTRDALQSESRRVNQAPEIISINLNTQEATVTGLANGQTSILNLIFTNLQNDGTVFASWDISIFVGTASVTNLLFPYHSSSTVDLSQWTIQGPTPALIEPDTATTSSVIDHNSVVACRNISAGTVNLVIRARPRYIFNRG